MTKKKNQTVLNFETKNNNLTKYISDIYFKETPCKTDHKFKTNKNLIIYLRLNVVGYFSKIYLKSYCFFYIFFYLSTSITNALNAII